LSQLSIQNKEKRLKQIKEFEKQNNLNIETALQPLKVNIKAIFKERLPWLDINNLFFDSKILFSITLITEKLVFSKMLIRIIII
jgi:hypothetical protein